jgi:MerR family transcriptional regulator, light-induced transcriptional regulator
MQEWSGSAEIPQARASMRRRRATEGVQNSAGLREKLSEILKARILPLPLAARPKTAAPAPVRSSLDPEGFAKQLVEGRLDDARAAIAARLASGATPLQVMIEDLSPAARWFGELWVRDDCDFFDVTLVTGALRKLLQEIAPDDARPLRARAPSILILLAPGETHSLGADIVASVFRQAGWSAVRGDNRTFLAALARRRHDVVGFSLSSDRHVGALAQAIGSARSVSRNPKLKILVGGPVFAEQPELADKLGADVCASGGDIAVQLPHTLLEA